jgi:hypothetical protein
MVRRTLTLTEEQRQELLRFRDHDSRPYLRERAAALLKIADGQTPHQVATRGLLKPRDPDTVYAWLDRYQASGAAGLIAHPQGGFRGRSLCRPRIAPRTTPPGTR